MPPTQLLLMFSILMPAYGLVAYVVSSFVLSKGAGTGLWAAICLATYLLLGLITLVLWPNGAGMGACVFGCVFGGSLARTRHIFR